MAASSSVQPRDFWSAFLNLNKNYHGYDGRLLQDDLDTVKRLARPFSFVPSARRVQHGVVESQLGSNGGDCQNEGQKLKNRWADEARNDYQDQRRNTEDDNSTQEPDVTTNNHAVCDGSLDGSFSGVSSPYDNVKTQITDLVDSCSTESVGDVMNRSSKTLSNSCELEESKVGSNIEIYDGQGVKKARRNTEIRPEQTCQISSTLSTQQHYSTDLADITMKIKLQAITSLLGRKKRQKTDALNVWGNVAVLCGSWTGDLMVNIHSSNVRGVYSYTDGTVVPSLDCSEDGEYKLVDLTLFLSELNKVHCLVNTERGVVTSRAVAWCVTSPGFGIHLDWQVQEKLTKLISDYNDYQSTPPAWYKLLVVVDEYRSAERDFPLTEVYHMEGSSLVKMVNFDFQ